MKIQARIESASIDAKTGDALLYLRTSESKFIPMLHLLQDKELTFEIKDEKKRSLNANAYAWVLIDKLAQKTGIPKREIYRQTILDVGGVSETVCTTDAAVDNLVRWWESRGYGWQAVKEPSKINGCTNVVLYCGSSQFTMEQMSRFLNLLKDECCSIQGISTATPNEIANMISLWGTE